MAIARLAYTSNFKLKRVQVVIQEYTDDHFAVKIGTGQWYTATTYSEVTGYINGRLLMNKSAAFIEQKHKQARK